MFVVAHNGARIWGGAERATVRLLAGLQSRGHKVLLLCNDAIVVAEGTRMGVPAQLQRIGGDIALHDAFSLSSLLRKLAPDAFLIGTYKKLSLAGLGAYMANIPRVVARVGLESDTPRNAKYRFALRRWIDGVAVNSQAIASAFTQLDGFGPEKVSVIHNGVIAPVRRSPPGTLRRLLEIPADAKVIGTVSRLAKQKRIDRLIDAVTTLPESVHCVIAGDGPRRSELEVKIRELNVGERVHLLGHRDDIGDVLDALDVFVVSSDKEGLSNAMLEAMSVGIPIVSTRVSGAADALTPADGSGAPGTIVEFSAGGIAQAVNGILADSSLRARMSAGASARAAEEFSMDRMLDRWESFLSQ